MEAEKQQQQKEQDFKKQKQLQQPQQVAEHDRKNSEQDEQEDFQIIGQLSEQQMQKMNQQHLQEVKTFYQTNRKYEIDYWYEELKQFTFKSEKFTLRSIQAYLLHWIYYHSQKQLIESHAQNDKKLSELYVFYTKLKSRLKEFYETQKTFESNKGCFIKLSTRSPKDSGYKFSQQEIQKTSQKLFQRLKPVSSQEEKASKQLIGNQIYRFFIDQSKQKFKVKSQDDFIQIFSHSQRIVVDLMDYSFLKESVFVEFEKGNFTRANQQFINIWVRQWVDFEWFKEVRCFYYDYKLTAATQYDGKCYFSELQGKQSQIKSLILKFFQSVLPQLKKLNMSQGVMDLVIDTQSQSVKLIEINVFNSNTRASLFSWNQDETQLKNGEQFCFRIKQNQEIIEKHFLCKLMGMIESDGVVKSIQKAMQRLGLSDFWNNYDE